MIDNCRSFVRLGDPACGFAAGEMGTHVEVTDFLGQKDKRTAAAVAERRSIFFEKKKQKAFVPYGGHRLRPQHSN